MSAPPSPTIPSLGTIELEIDTPRLALRPFTVADVDGIWPYVSDPAFPKHMRWNAHADKAETLAFLQRTIQERSDNVGVTWGIRHEGKLVGAIALENIRWQLAAWRVDRAELGYWLAPALWNKGLATEAAHHVLLFAYDTLGLHKVTVGCFEQNVASRRVIEKLGFRHVGRHEDDVWRDGAWHTHLEYELTASQWSDVSTTMPISRPLRP